MTKKFSKMIMNSKKKTEDIDNEVVERILMNRKIGIAVTSWEVKANIIFETDKY